MSSTDLRRMAIGVAVGALVVLGVVAMTQSPGSSLAAVLDQRCGIGLAGTALTVTFQGPTADAECAALDGTTSAGGSWYRLAGEEPVGYLVCRQRSGANTLTVRDQGSLMVYGHSVCDSLGTRASQADPPTRADYTIPFASAPDREWCLRWTDATPWEYGAEFQALSAAEQDAVRTYCNGEGMPDVLPPAP